MTQAFLIVSWDNGVTEVSGPFDSHETAKGVIEDGEAELAYAMILGPLPVAEVFMGLV